jgi:uncharacterized protein YbjT (DUF2867 family)
MIDMEKGATILITGATGQQGGAVARQLLSAGHKVKAMSRNPDSEKARALAALGAEVVPGDLNDAASLKRAFDGAWGVFAVQNTWEAGVEGEEEQGKRTAEVAREQGVQHFVYTSVGSAERETGIPHFDNKWRVEETVRGLDFPSSTILRPVFFMENWVSPWFKPAIDEGTVAIGVKPDTRLQMIAVDDIGKYGRLAFEQHEALNGQAIEIAGDELTMPQVAEIIGRTSGKPVSFYQVPIEQVREFSEDFALMLEWFDRVGYGSDISGNAAKYGIEPTSFEAWAGRVAW